MTFINQVHSTTQVATRLFLDFYDRLSDPDILPLIAQTVNHQMTRRKITFEWWRAFPQIRRWIGERKTQEIFAGQLELEAHPFEGTFRIDRLEARLNRDAAFVSDPQDMADYFIEGIQNGRDLEAIIPLRHNEMTQYDGQRIYDTEHRHPNDKVFSNIVPVTRNVVDAPSIYEAKAELRAARKRLIENRYVNSAPYRVPKDTSNLVVIVKSQSVHDAYDDLLQEEKFPDNTMNRYREKFELIYDPDAPEAVQNTVDYIWAEPNGMRPVVYVPALDPGPIEPIAPLEDKRDQYIDFGIDLAFAVGPAFPQPTCRVDPTAGGA